jgi:hypothetical protein
MSFDNQNDQQSKPQSYDDRTKEIQQVSQYEGSLSSVGRL